MPTRRIHSGVTLIELIVFILIVSVALAGSLTVFNITSRSSADPIIRKQLLAIAEALLEEVQAQPFTWCDPDDANALTAQSYAGCAVANNQQNSSAAKSGETRGSNTTPFDNVFDYNAEALTSAISSTAGNPLLVPSGYSARVDVASDTTLGPSAGKISTADAVLRITVTVCRAATCPSSGAETLALEGYRTRHSPNMLP